MTLAEPCSTGEAIFNKVKKEGLISLFIATASSPEKYPDS
jgi:hypothetical protein